MVQFFLQDFSCGDILDGLLIGVRKDAPPHIIPQQLVQLIPLAREYLIPRLPAPDYYNLPKKNAILSFVSGHLDLAKQWLLVVFLFRREANSVS